MNKKYIALIILIFSIFSCMSISSRERFEKGDYLGSLNEIGRELKRRKKITEDYQNSIIIRSQNIERILKERLKSSQDDLNISISYFELWKMGYIVEKNPLISKYTPLSVNSVKNFEYLEKSLSFMLNYILKDKTKLILFEELLNSIYNENISNTNYEKLHKEYSKILAEKYYDLAKESLLSKDLNKAKDFYYKSYKIYEYYDKNYKNTYSKYFKLIREIEINDAKEFERIAKNLYHKNNLKKAKYNFEKALEIYIKYDLENDIEKTKKYLTTINLDEKTINFYEVYNRAIKYLEEAEKYRKKRDLVYEKRNLNLALEELNKALNISENKKLKDMASEKILIINKKLKNLF